MLISAATPSLACKWKVDAFEKEVFAIKEICSHALCGTTHITDPQTKLKFNAYCRSIVGDVSFAMQRQGVVFFGEVHDNNLHHRLRAMAVTEIGSDNPSLGNAAIVFEQVRADQQLGLDAFAKFDADDARVGTVADLKRFLDWDKSGWSKDGYDPLLQAALDARLPIYPGDVIREAIKKVAKQGEAALPAEERTRLKLDVPLGPKLDDASLTEIEESHCGMLPKTALGGMAFAQRYRDANLADVALKAAEKHGSAIVIAGNGHVRTDRGVPWYIRQRAPDKKVVSVMLVEVEDGKNDPENYVPRDPDGKPAADYIVFTPRAERPDPCEAMRKNMGK
ncbi:MAG: ChaN family lipoprotein [Hyphomicrobium sp.]